MKAALRPTPLPTHGEGVLKGGRQAGFHTFFEYQHWWDTYSLGQKERVEAMLRTMDVGKSLFHRMIMRLVLTASNTMDWLGTCWLALQEMWRYPVYGHGLLRRNNP